MLFQILDMAPRSKKNLGNALTAACAEKLEEFIRRDQWIEIPHIDLLKRIPYSGIFMWDMLQHVEYRA